MSKEREISLSVDEILQLVSQHGGQLSASQLDQAIQKLQGSTQEKSNLVDAVTQNKQEEINTCEAFRSNTYTKTRLWDFDDKQIAASEQTERVRSVDHKTQLDEIAVKTAQLELARKEHQFGIQQQLDHLKVIAATNSNNFNNAIHFEYAKFNSAVSEPLAPDTGADDKDSQK